MADRPIIFSSPMVRALLEGRKTQTRRVLKPQPPEWATFCQQPDMLNALHQWVPSGLWRWSEAEESSLRPLRQWPVDRHGDHYWLKPPYSVGDRLWVRETWSARMDGGWTIADARRRLGLEKILYKVSEQEAIDGWWPSIYMPREFSRITLDVSNVRVQRLQDITEEDAIAEGVEVKSADPEWFGYRDYLNPKVMNPAARGSYRTLWNSLNAKRGCGWDVNPWVVALTFTVHRCNIDHMARAA